MVGEARCDLGVVGEREAARPAVAKHQAGEAAPQPEGAEATEQGADGDKAGCLSQSRRLM
jgi:hypothetical protein